MFKVCNFAILDIFTDRGPGVALWVKHCSADLADLGWFPAGGGGGGGGSIFYIKHDSIANSFHYHFPIILI